MSSNYAFTTTVHSKTHLVVEQGFHPIWFILGFAVHEVPKVLRKTERLLRRYSTVHCLVEERDLSERVIIIQGVKREGLTFRPISSLASSLAR